MSLLENAPKNILETIGKTPVVRLGTLAENSGANIFAKCDFLNPGGSVKDRIALNIVNQAEKSGALKPGGTIIEATSGNTGVGLAMVAALRGYQCIFVMADKQSEDKRKALRSMGAKVVICPTDVEPEDERSYYSVAAKLVRDTPNSFYANQYHNPDNPETHVHSTGPEIWEQCGKELDAFVCTIGTGGTISGCAKYLKAKNPNIQIIGVDPVGSIFHELFHKGTMGKAHSYLVEGIGEDFLPTTMDIKCMDDVVQVTDKECFISAQDLIKKEALLAGASSGAALAGALKYLEQRPFKELDRKANILIFLPDASNRYLSKHLDDDWMKDKGFYG